MRYVDSREAMERRGPLIQHGFQVKAMQCGDVQFPESSGHPVLIENKKISQFLTDMTSGQLTKQAHNMLQATQWPILMLEGHWIQVNGRIVDTQITWAQAWDYIQSLQDIGIRLQLTSDANHTVQRILQLADYYAKGLHKSVSRRLAGDARVHILANIPGIGETRARELLRYFHNIEGIVAAKPEDLQTVDNIGPKLAGIIHSFWRS